MLRKKFENSLKNFVNQKPPSNQQANQPTNLRKV